MPFKFNPFTGNLDQVNSSSSGGSGGGSGQEWIVNVLLLPDGVNPLFTTPDIYSAGTLKVYLNGLRQIPGLEYDFTETSDTSFTMNTVPLVTDNLIVDYALPFVPFTSSEYGEAKYDTTGVYA